MKKIKKKYRERVEGILVSARKGARRRAGPFVITRLTIEARSSNQCGSSNDKWACENPFALPFALANTTAETGMSEA